MQIYAASRRQKSRIFYLLLIGIVMWRGRD